MAKLLVMVTMAMGAAASLAGSAQAATFPAWAGPPSRVSVAHLDLDHFFNPVTTVHVGDRVRFALNGFHTVTFPARGQAAPGLITPGPTVTGVKDPAGNPLWFDGKLPRLQINPLAAFAVGGTTVTGSSLVSSGVPAGNGPPKPFVVKFTHKGTFKFFCIVHPGMQGTVNVLAKGRAVPSAAQDKRAATHRLTVLLRVARRLAKVKPGPGVVLAGNDRGGVAWLRFFPSRITVKAGQSVQFLMRAPYENHTITFGPAAYTTGLEQALNQVQPNPNGPPTIFFDPIGSLPSDPFPLPPYTGANHGNGFENAGVLAGRPGTPLPTKATFTFTKAGTYHFECLIHQNMDGTVVVTA